MKNNRISKRKIILTVLVFAAAIVLFWLALQFLTGRLELDEQFGDTGIWGKEDSEGAEISINGSDYVTDDDLDTYLLIGTDGGGEDLGEGYKGELADFLVLLVVDNTTEKFGFFTIDRNTMTDIEIADEEGEITVYEDQQICLAHWYGENDEFRNQNTVNAVSALMGGLDIDSYYSINMDDIGKFNDAIGGVIVDIDSDMTDIDEAFEEGTSVLLQGDQAEKYLRARSSLKDPSNAARMKRQQQYMENVYALLTGQFRENPEYVNDLYDQLHNYVESDGSGKDLSVAVNHMLQYDNAGFITFSGTTKLGDTQGDDIEHEEFYIDEASVIRGLQKVVDFTESE